MSKTSGPATDQLVAPHPDVKLDVDIGPSVDDGVGQEAQRVEGDESSLGEVMQALVQAGRADVEQGGDGALGRNAFLLGSEDRSEDVDVGVGESAGHAMSVDDGLRLDYDERMVMRDLSGLKVPAAAMGNPPDSQARYAPRLAQAWADTLDDGSLAMAFPEARIRHSWAGMCARKIGYMVTGAEETNPIDLADRWRFGIGTTIHEKWQAIMADAFPGCEVEKRVWIEECKSAGHIDCFIPGDPTTASTSLDGDRGGPDDRLLDLAQGQDEGGLRSDRRPVAKSVDGTGPSHDVRGAGRPDPGRPTPRSPLSSPGMLQPRPSGTGDTGGEQSTGRDDEDLLPEGSRVPPREPGSSDRLEAGQGMQRMRAPAERSLVGGTAIELKTINGFGAKLAIGARGPAEGPRSSAILQGALNGLASGAGEVVVVYLSLENLSPREFQKIGGHFSWQKFCAEWTFPSELFLPMAIREVNRMKRILEIIDEGQLPPRSVPDLPQGARIVDPRRGTWQISQDGAITDAGSTWMCGYCSFTERCADDMDKGI